MTKKAICSAHVPILLQSPPGAGEIGRQRRREGAPRGQIFGKTDMSRTNYVSISAAEPLPSPPPAFRLCSLAPLARPSQFTALYNTHLRRRTVQHALAVR